VRPLAIFAALAAGCSSSSSPPAPAPTSEERACQRAFEAWRAAILAEDVEKIFLGMSSMMLSEWMYQRLSDPDDPVLRQFRPRLRGPASDDLDVWFVDNRSRNPQRPSRLPGSVFVTTWLYEAFKVYYEPFKASMKNLYESCEVAAVYVDAAGASVVVRNKMIKASDLYIMVYEGGWKVDHHKEPGPHVPK